MSPLSSAGVEKIPNERHLQDDSGSDDLATSRTQESPPPRSRPLTSLLDWHISHEEIEKHRPRLRGAHLTGFLAFIAGTGFTLFGYDQGVLSALLTTKSVCGPL